MSHYKIINKIRYDRNVLELELADSYIEKQKYRRISTNDAKLLYNTALAEGKFTTIARRSLDYILTHYKWAIVAKKWFSSNLLGLARIHTSLKK